jgi:hypothetical protein
MTLELNFLSWDQVSCGNVKNTWVKAKTSRKHNILELYKLQAIHERNALKCGMEGCNKIKNTKCAQLSFRVSLQRLVRNNMISFNLEQSHSAHSYTTTAISATDILSRRLFRLPFE